MGEVVAEGDLGGFRADWTGEAVLSQLQRRGGRGLVNWPIGVGKSHNMDKVIEAAARGGGYDLIAVFCPTRQVINERRWVIVPPDDVRTVVLDPRPSDRCGRERNAEWCHYGTHGLGLLGRREICSACPRRQGCPWPGQYGKGLRGARVIYAAQAHLERDPRFVDNLKHWTRADRVLVIIDEDKLLLTGFRRRIHRRDLEMFASVLQELAPQHEQLGHWRDQCGALLLVRQSTDLRSRDWKFSYLKPELAVAIQGKGREKYGAEFVDIHFSLRSFARSALASREICSNRAIEFAARPSFSDDLLIYSGTAIPQFVEFRLQTKLGDLFPGLRFRHSGTRWYNIASRIGTRQYFKRNADQILDFYAQLVARRLSEGRRVLLVAKKHFVAFCAQEMKRRLRALGHRKIRIATGKWNRVKLSDPNVIPLISYGIVGTNLFEGFDAAYCLTGYYTRLDVINGVVQDVLASDYEIPLRLEMAGRPLRRRVVVTNPDDRGCDVGELANWALRNQEMDVVLQAVGRVRPFTRPREIITFQAADHPLISYDAEFSFLGDARGHFNIDGTRGRSAAQTHRRVQAARIAGQTQSQAARSTGLSLSTVKRYWRGVMKPPILYKGS